MKNLLSAASAAVAACLLAGTAFGQTVNAKTPFGANSLKIAGQTITTGTITVKAMGPNTSTALSLTTADGDFNGPDRAGNLYVSTITNGAIASGFTVADQATAAVSAPNTPLTYLVTITSTAPVIGMYQVSLPPGTVTGTAGFALDHFAPAQVTSVFPGALGVGTALPANGQCTGAGMYTTYTGTTVTGLYTCVAGQLRTIPFSSGSAASFAAAAPWTANTPYSAGTVVTNAGSTYVAPSTPASFTSGSTFNASNWTLLAAAGANGTNGTSPVFNGAVTVNTGTVGSAATASIDNTTPAAPKLILTLPAAAAGQNGTTPVFGAPTASGSSYGSQPSVTITGAGTSGSPYVLAFTVPAGQPGANATGSSLAVQVNGVTGNSSTLNLVPGANLAITQNATTGAVTFAVTGLGTAAAKNIGDFDAYGAATTAVNALPTAARTGNYSDLTNKPTIPSSTSQLTNDAGFVTASGAATAAPVQTVAGRSGAVVLSATDVSGLAASATTDATSASNINKGTLSPARLATGNPGTLAGFDQNGLQTVGSAAAYIASTGPIKVAPYNVSAQTSAGTALTPTTGATSYRIANITNGARLLTSGVVSQVKTYIGAVPSDTTGLYFELWRINPSGTFGLVCRSGNLLSATTASATNTYTLANCNAQAGDYPAMYLTSSGTTGASPFTSSTAYAAATYPSYVASGAQLTSTEDFMGGTTGATYTAVQNMPIEVYLAKGPVVVAMGDSKMQGIPFSGNFLQSAAAGSTVTFPIAQTTTYAQSGTATIDLSNQPIAWVSRILGYSYANVAITGSTSTAQLNYELPTVLALKPAVLVYSGTINDSAYSIPTSTSLSNATSIYNQAIAAGVQKVVMTGAEPAGSIAETTWANTSYGGDAMNAALKSFCQAQTACVWVGDQVASTLGQYRTGGAVGSLHNIQPSYAAADNLHFNNYGAQAMGLIEANAIETPSTVGTTVAVPNAYGTASRVRTAMVTSHSGTLGWRWQDTRDYLQMETQGLDAAAQYPGTGQPGQESVGCVLFVAGKGYGRCDGQFTWSQQSAALTVPTLYATTISGPGGANTKFTSSVDMAVTGTSTNITSLTSSNSGGAAGIAGLQYTGTSPSNLYYPMIAWGAGTPGLGSTAGWWDASLSHMMFQVTKTGRICFWANNTAGVTTYGGSTAENGCPTSSGAVLYPTGIFATQGMVAAPYFSSAIGTAIASTATIAPVAGVTHITGTAAISTVTPPAPCTVAARGCTLTLIPDGAFTTATGGNIALASTAVVNRQLILTYDPATALWYPNY